MRVTRHIDEVAHSRLPATLAGVRIRRSHTALFAHIDWNGTRVGDIAERAQSTKQAVSELIMELVAMGVLEKIVDPKDQRARLVRFTELGQRGILHGLSVLREIEAEIAAELRAPAMSAWADTLMRVEAITEKLKTEGGGGRRSKEPTR